MSCHYQKVTQNYAKRRNPTMSPSVTDTERVTRHFHEKAGAVNSFFQRSKVREMFPLEPPVVS
jgi:hypothetical protein